jgi:aminoglycoside phosphotransferase (APT) family kinase protein
VQPETVAGRYELQAELGGGGMAVVHLVLDRETGRRLALKRPTRRADLEQRRKSDELFAREFHTLAQLAHPRIVEVYDYALDEHGPFYTMELLDGGDLQQLVPADWRRVCAIARDVCSALSLLHSRRIVHRDISPRNIRCTTDGTAKLIDFGAMTLMGPTKELVGTPVCCRSRTSVHLPGRGGGPAQPPVGRARRRHGSDRAGRLSPPPSAAGRFSPRGPARATRAGTCRSSYPPA